jgi:DNA polymerase I-like protein with 3'-5' exonuclease and polymerase domains
MNQLTIALDFETALLDGTPSVDIHKPDFRAISCAFAWYEGDERKTRYVEGEELIRKQLRKLVKGKHRVVVHNLAFDSWVVKVRFPECFEGIDWHADTMRLVQLGDNGQPDGVGLQACVRRWLPSRYHNHKEPFYELIRERGGKGGQDLHLLEPKELEAYAVGDAVATIELYRTLTSYFKDLQYDWTLDHVLYCATSWLTASSRCEGILVDREQAKQNLVNVLTQIAEGGERFANQHKHGIREVESRLREAALAKRKTERGKAGVKESEWRFNIDSDRHLKMLFCDVYGMEAKYLTPKGAPSMSAKFIHQYGDAGKELRKRGNLQITAAQLESLIALTEEDGRLHADVKVNGTKTGRLAAGQV